MISFHPKEKKNLITKITDGLGVSTKIEYKNLTDPSVYQAGSITYIYPFVKRTLPFNVVSKINLDNGIDSLGNDITYHYTGIKYNVHGKGLLGFDKLSTYDDINELTTEKHFTLNLDYAFPYLQEMFSYQGNYILHKTIADYTLHHYGKKRIFPYVNTHEQRDYVQNLFSRTEYKYTAPAGTQPHGYAFGRPNAVITRKGYTVGSAPSPVQKELTEQVFEYPELYNLLPAYIQNKAVKVITNNTRTGQATFTSTQSFAYNPNNGLLLSTVSNPASSDAMSTAFSYDSYGNVSYKGIWATGQNVRTQAYEYDITNRFVTQTWNQAYPNVKTTTGYNPITGDLMSINHTDGLKTDYTYDAFGRLKTATENTGAASTTGFYTGLGVSYWPSSAKYVTVTIPNTGGHQYNFYDRLHRLVRTAQKGFNGQDILMDKKYNAKGQLYQSTKPYFEGHTPQTTTYSYDIRGRLVKESHPEGDIDYGYLIVGGDLVTTVMNAAGQEKKSTVDISGRLVKSEDHGGTLSYTYHSNGNVKEVGLSGSGVVAEYEYDDFGRKTKETDPNYGSYEYTYNPFGELTSKKDPKGNIFNYTYDQAGNLSSKNGPDGYFQYTYDSYTGRLGQIDNLINGDYIWYIYGLGDQLEIEQRYSTAFGGYANSFTYDNYGRMATRTYPYGKEVHYHYSTNDGSLSKITANLPQFTEIYSVRSKNQYGQVVEYDQGSPWGTINPKLTTVREYDQHGLLQGRKNYLNSSSFAAWDFTYDFDAATGNLQSREDHYYDLNEGFSYDNLNRLTHVQTTLPTNPPTGQLKQVVDYAPNGNILEKTDAGAFSYDPANRLSEIEPYVDVPTATQTLTYTPFNKVATIEEGNREAVFSYWPDEERQSMELKENGVLQKRKIYAPGFEMEWIPSKSVSRQLNYIHGPESNIVAVWETRNMYNDLMYYTVTDYLGSITDLIGQGGWIAESRYFDAWGRMRSASTWTEEPPTHGSMTDEGWDRGFTGHEHLPQFGIINMNGRLYDPVMGRMFSPDPYIIGTDNTQGYNRYTYALNNPLIYTDPSGNFIGLAFGVSAFLGEFASNLIYGNSDALGTAFKTATQAYNDVGNAGQFPIYSNGNFTITGGFNAFALGVSAQANYTNGNSTFSIIGGYSLLGGGFGNIGYRYDDGTWAVSSGLGIGQNHMGYGGSLTYKGYGLGYYQTNYGNATGPDGLSNPQAVGAAQLFWPGGSFRIENDFLAFKGEDRWRSNAMELSMGNFVIGTKLYNNDPKEEGKGIYGGFNYIGKANRGTIWKTWKNGKTYYSPLYVGVRGPDGHVERIGYSHPIFQDRTQNWVHKWVPFGRQHFFSNYESFRHGVWIETGFYNNFSLWGR